MNKRSWMFLLMMPLILAAQERGLEQQTDIAPVNPEQRVALVIGNANYKEAPLLNPVNDARDIATMLESCGFKVILRENANLVEIKKAIREFGRALHSNTVGLFYYSGHGMQVNGENYLIPIDAEFYSEEEVDYETVSAGFALAQMEAARNRMNIVILDACRNNPFARGFRSATRGLATMNAPTGTLIAYATAPGATASDGVGKNGLYTEELLAQMRIPGNKIEDVFKRVRASVMNRSNSQQIPWEASSLIGDFYFVPASSQPSKETVALAGPVEISTDPTALWWGDGQYYWLSVGGREIQNETVSGYSGDDLLVYHASSNATYVLADFKAHADSKKRPAGLFKTSETVFWKAKDGLYWLTVNGIAIQQDVTSAWAGPDLVVYHRPSNLTYVLRDFDASNDERYRTAEVLKADPAVYWRASEGLYHLILNGTAIHNSVVDSWSGNDLLAYYPVNNTTYVLSNYVNRQDNVIRAADAFPGPCSAIWRASGNYYWLYVRGVSIQSETTSSYEGDDLIVVHTSTQQKYRLRNFKNRGDNQLRVAECME